MDGDKKGIVVVRAVDEDGRVFVVAHRDHPNGPAVASWNVNGCTLTNEWTAGSVSGDERAELRQRALDFACSGVCGSARELAHVGKWIVLERYSRSGKRLFACTVCGRLSATPDKRCGGRCDTFSFEDVTTETGARDGARGKGSEL